VLNWGTWEKIARMLTELANNYYVNCVLIVLGDDVGTFKTCCKGVDLIQGELHENSSTIKSRKVKQLKF
jgi:hypothetical protein